MAENTHHEFAPSSLDRLANCPGSYLQSKPFENIEDNDIEDVKQGNKLHDYLAGKEVELTQDEEIAIEKAKEIESAILQKYFDQGANIIWEFTELEIEILDNAENVLTRGTADKVYILDNGTAVLIDWKFGRIKVYASKNMQLIAYSTGVIQKYKLEKVDAYIVQPFINWVDNYIYTNLFEIIEEIVNNAKNGSVFAKGDWCTYCPALKYGKCPLHQLATINTDFDIKTCDDQMLANTYETGKKLMKFVDQVKAEMKSRIEANGIAGYSIKERTSKRELSDINTVINRMNDDYGITTDEILPYIKLSVADLEKLFIEKKFDEGFTKKEGKKVFGEFIKDYIEVKTAREIVKNGETDT